jgi:hypothetical protein
MLPSSSRLGSEGAMPIREYAPLCLDEGPRWGRAAEVRRGLRRAKILARGAIRQSPAAAVQTNQRVGAVRGRPSPSFVATKVRGATGSAISSGLL